MIMKAVVANMEMPMKSHYKTARGRLQEAIAISHVADGIRDEEVWRQGFLEELRRLSLVQATELGGGVPVVDKGPYRLRLEEWVHGRVLLMILELVAWMGPEWASHFEQQSSDDFVELVRAAFQSNL
jgi:hypothetical protein